MTRQIQYGDRLLKFELNSVANLEGKIRIKVHPRDRIEVQAPIGVCESEVRDALKKRLRWVTKNLEIQEEQRSHICLLYTSPSPRDLSTSRMPSSA